MLQLIHVGHLGAEKQKRLARQSLYWPNMNKDIDSEVQECNVCLKYRRAQSKQPLLETQDGKLGPWDRVGMDLMMWEGKTYLVMVDYFSNYPEVALLTTTTASSVINQVKSVFGRHGIPRIVCSDNGPQFSAWEFAQFAKSWGFQHQTSSPYYPRANGQAEKAVGIVKQLLNRAKERGEDPYLALLAYRKAPRELGASPSQLLMGRTIRSQLPEIMHGKQVVSEAVEMKRERIRKASEKYYNQGAKELTRLHRDAVVRVRGKHWDEKAVVLDEVAPRSYRVRLENGAIYRRNRQELLQVRENFENIQGETVEEKEMGDSEVNVSHEGSEDTGENIAMENNNSAMEEPPQLIRRSGRVVKPVKRMDL